MPDQTGSSARRIRIGLTGLALAFLLVLLGSVINRSSRDDQTNAVDAAATNLPKEPNEPLAELGVAPGAADVVAADAAAANAAANAADAQANRTSAE